MALFLSGNKNNVLFWIYREYFFYFFVSYLKTLTNVKVIYLRWNFGVIVLLGEKQKYSKRNLSHSHFFVCKCHMDPPGNERGPPRWETDN